MANVTFDEEYAPRSIGEKKTGGLIGFLIDTGVAHTEKEAAVVLLGTFFVLLALVVGVLFFGGSDTELPPPQVVPGAPIL